MMVLRLYDIDMIGFHLRQLTGKGVFQVAELANISRSAFNATTVAFETVPEIDRLFLYVSTRA